MVRENVHSSIPEPQSDLNLFSGASGLQRKNVETPKGRRYREVNKQVSTYFPLSSWKRLRAEAARKGVSISDLLQKLLAPLVKKLPPAND